MSRIHETNPTMSAKECSSCLFSGGLFLQAADRDANLLQNASGDWDLTLEEERDGEQVSLKYWDALLIDLERLDKYLLLSEEARE